MIPFVRRLALVAMAALAGACGRMEQSARARPGDGAVIYQSTILTMDPNRPVADAVIIKNGAVIDLGSIDDLVQAYSGASFDERFLRKTLMPAFVDVRSPPNALKVLEVPCEGNLLMEEILSIGADGAPVRIVASDPTAMAAAAEAAARIPAGAAIGRVSVEARGAGTAAAGRAISQSGAALILSGDPAPEACGRTTPADETIIGPAPVLSGRIALAPSAGDDNFLAAAGSFLREGADVRLSPQEALEAITADAAFALGLEAESGVIAPGRGARFAVLDRNPLATPGEAWGAIRLETFAAAE